jgi:hypothetical protein
MTKTTYAREALAMQRWLARIHQADLTVSQVQAKIKLLHTLCEAQADLIGALVEERQQAQNEVDTAWGVVRALRGRYLDEIQERQIESMLTGR